MGLARDRVPNKEGQANQNDDGGYDGKEKADTEQGAHGLLHVGHVSEQAQRPATDSHTQRTGELTEESPETVINALAPLAGHLFVVLHHVGEHAPGEDPLG